MLLELLGARPEDEVPQWGGDAVTVTVVLEVVTHVLLAQLLAGRRRRHVVMEVEVGVVVGQVTGDEARERGVAGRRSEDQREEAEEQRGEGDAERRRHDEPERVVGVLVMDAVHDEVEATAERVIRELLGSDLVVLSYAPEMSGWGSIAVTVDDGAPFTFLVRQDSSYFLELFGNGSDDLGEALAGAWTLQVFDPVWQTVRLVQRFKVDVALTCVLPVAELGGKDE